jgi:hypothetical protein
MKNRSDFLFAAPCAAFGVARFLDFSGTFDAYNSSVTEGEADSKATFADWRSVYDSFEEAVNNVVVRG